ncbi:hypothetical protein B0T18DRAFT_428297 [Schizothecium vesticola]|uniref:Uncharacterized protein n=1 Tax=Schizothecium vesticola TaxID=314040 RepID=A0AA40F3A9_9PEZI|nr:hypothetical protein B0T18DRAFT_428297 [Schizothecium vesticola]
MIHPISDSRLSILGSCIFLLLAMPRLARSLLSKLSPLQYLPSSSRPTPKPKPSHPTLLDGLSAISHVLVVVVASNLACGGPAFETRLFITLRQQLLEFSRPAALLAASTPIPVPRRNSKRIASVRDEKLEPEALGRCDSAQPQPAEKTAPIPTQDNSASPSPSSAPVVHPSPPSAPVIHPSPPSAAHSQPSPPSAPLSRPPPIPRRSSSLNKAFDARRIKLVVSASPSSSPSSSFSSISSSSDRESRARRRPEMAVKGGDTFRVTLSEKKSGDPRLDARVRMELDPGMWLRSGRVAASGRIM